MEQSKNNADEKAKLFSQTFGVSEKMYTSIFSPHTLAKSQLSTFNYNMQKQANTNCHDIFLQIEIRIALGILQLLKNQEPVDLDKEERKIIIQDYFNKLSNLLDLTPQTLMQYHELTERHEFLQIQIQQHYFATMNFIANHNGRSIWDLNSDIVVNRGAMNELRMEYIRYKQASQIKNKNKQIKK